MSNRKKTVALLVEGYKKFMCQSIGEAREGLLLGTICLYLSLVLYGYPDILINKVNEISPKLAYLDTLFFNSQTMFVFGISSIIITFLRVAIKPREKDTTFISIDKEYELGKKTYSSRQFLRHKLCKIYQKGELDSVKISKENDAFLIYTKKMLETISTRIEVLDKKASNMLDKGSSYAKNGIYLYITVIVIWQMIFFATGDGLTPAHISGLISCSILFIFIEFISAWFMKQHQHFVNTSAYLLKVKSVFDKYILLYLVFKETKKDPGNNITEKHIENLLDILGREFEWPPGDAFTCDKKEISFAKELLDGMTTLCKELTILNKNK